MGALRSQRSRRIIETGTMGGHSSAQEQDRPERGRLSSVSARSLRLLLFLPVFFCLLVPAGVLAQQGLQLAYEKAQQLFEQGSNAEAAAAFQAVLLQTYQARAALYEKEGSWKQAEEDLKAALDLDPGRDRVRYELAYAEFHL